MKKKYSLLKDDFIEYDGRRLYRIKAEVDIPSIGIKSGDTGGYVESEKNLSQLNEAWIGDEAQVYDHARVSNKAQIRDSAKVFGWAEVYGDAQISENARVFGAAQVFGDAQVSGNAVVCRKMHISEGTVN